MACHPEQPFTAAQEDRIRQMIREDRVAGRTEAVRRFLRRDTPLASLLPADCTPLVSRSFDKCASDGEADGAGRKVQGVAVHDGRYATDPAAPSCGKADDISGEARG